MRWWLALVLILLAPAAGAQMVKGRIQNPTFYDWDASMMTSDAAAGNNCNDAARTQLTAGAGPRSWVVNCPLSNAETDGFIYGNMVLPENWVPTTVKFEITAIFATDGGAGTLHGTIAAQCVGDTDTLGVAWSADSNLDVVEAAADVVWDVRQFAASPITPTGTCAQGDVLWWRWKACDVDATPSTGCTSSTATTISDTRIVEMRAEFEQIPVTP